MLLRAFRSQVLKISKDEDWISGHPQMYSPWPTGYTSSNQSKLLLSLFAARTCIVDSKSYLCDHRLQVHWSMESQAMICSG